MKNFTKSLIAICISTMGITINAFSVNYISAGAGPAAWNVSTSWLPNGIPTANDNVTINVGHTITNNSLTTNCKDLTIQGTLSGTSPMILNIKGNYTISAGGIETGTGSIIFIAGAAGRTISGPGTFSTGIRYTFGTGSNLTINSNVTIVKTFINGIQNTTVTNLGNVTFNNTVNTNSGATWINSTNSFLALLNSGFMSAAGTFFTANAIGNTVRLKYAAGNIPITTSGYYNLFLAGTASGTKTLLSNTIVANNLTMNSNNNLNSNNFNISVGGNWLNSATFTASTGKTVTFNGTVAQTVSNTIGTTTLKELTINNNAGVTLTTGTYILDEVLTITNGTFNTGGRPFTMTSTAVRTARIAPITGTGAIAGNFTIQRFITGRDTSYADLASPVQSSTFLDWDNELPAISYTPSVTGSAQSSASIYDEGLDTYLSVTSSGTSLNAGQGFEVFLSGGFSYTNFPATTMTTVGVPNQGDFDLSGSISNNVQGWNLVGNPFASSILWSSIYSASGSAGSGLYDYIEMYDYTIGDWNGYTSADAIEVGATQGFWVYGLPGNVPVTLLIPETSKTTASNSSIKSSTKLQPFFNLKITNVNNSFAHNFKISSSGDALDGLDAKDIPFRKSINKTTPSLYSFVEGKKININNFNSSNDNYSMPLRTETAIAGNYTIEASGFDFISDYTCIKLEDKLLNKTVDLTSENVYSFTMEPTDNVDRFIIHFSKDSNCKAFSDNSSIANNFANEVSILPTAQGNVINFNLSETTNTKISVVNILGQTLVDVISIDANTQSLNVSLPEGYSGMYIVKVESSKGAITKKFVKK